VTRQPSSRRTRTGRAGVVELGRLAYDDGPEPRMRMLCRSVRLSIYRYSEASACASDGPSAGGGAEVPDWLWVWGGNLRSRARDERLRCSDVRGVQKPISQFAGELADESRTLVVGDQSRSHVRPGCCVGGRGLSPGSIVTCLGRGTSPPRGPRSMYSPGRDGFSPGFCSGIVVLLQI
jgi:hypothetical protein